MSDELVKRLRDRAKEERLIQANNEAVATALRGQRLLFDQGHRSPSNTYAVRLALNHEDCARHDAKLAADWDDAADRIEALTARADALEQHVADLLVDVPCACGYDNPSDPACEHCGMDPAALTEQLEAARADAKEAEAYAEELEKQHDKVWDEAVWAVAQVVDQEMARIGFVAGPDGFGRRAEMRNVIVEELKSVQSMRATLAEIEGGKE
jgi:hypothetical protein